MTFKKNRIRKNSRTKEQNTQKNSNAKKKKSEMKPIGTQERLVTTDAGLKEIEDDKKKN